MNSTFSPLAAVVSSSAILRAGDERSAEAVLRMFGTKKRNMSRVLRILKETSENLMHLDGVHLGCAWGVADGAIKPEFFDKCREIGVQVAYLEDESGEQLHSFVRRGTRGLVGDVCAHVLPGTRCLVASAAVARARWVYAMHPCAGHSGSFDSCAWVGHSEAHSLRVRRGEDGSSRVLVNLDSELSLVLGMPGADQSPEEWLMVSCADGEETSKWIRELRTGPLERVAVQCPSVSNESILDLSSSWPAEARGFLPGVVEGDSTQVSAVLQRTRFSLNAQGVGMEEVEEEEGKVVEDGVQVLVFDRPFVACVVHLETEAIISVSVIHTPTPKQSVHVRLPDHCLGMLGGLFTAKSNHENDQDDDEQLPQTVVCTVCNSILLQDVTGCTSEEFVLPRGLDFELDCLRWPDVRVDVQLEEGRGCVSVGKTWIPDGSQCGLVPLAAPRSYLMQFAPALPGDRLSFEAVCGNPYLRHNPGMTRYFCDISGEQSPAYVWHQDSRAGPGQSGTDVSMDMAPPLYLGCARCVAGFRRKFSRAPNPGEVPVVALSIYKEKPKLERKVDVSGVGWAPPPKPAVLGGVFSIFSRPAAPPKPAAEPPKPEGGEAEKPEEDVEQPQFLPKIHLLIGPTRLALQHPAPDALLASSFADEALQSSPRQPPQAPIPDIAPPRPDARPPRPRGLDDIRHPRPDVFPHLLRPPAPPPPPPEVPGQQLDELADRADVLMRRAKAFRGGGVR